MRGWGRGFVSHPIDLIGVAGRRDFVSQGADLGEGGDVEQCRAGRRVQGDFVSQGVDFVGYLVSKSVESVRDHFVSHRGSNFERCRNLSKWDLRPCLRARRRSFAWLGLWSTSIWPRRSPSRGNKKGPKCLSHSAGRIDTLVLSSQESIMTGYRMSRIKGCFITYWRGSFGK